jgi:transposase-like protein
MNENLNEQSVFISRRAEQQWSRMQGIKMIRAGYPATEVATLFGVTTRAVYKWIATFVEQGQNGLIAKSGAGRPTKISPDQMSWRIQIRSATPADQVRSADAPYPEVIPAASTRRSNQPCQLAPARLECATHGSLA